MQQALLHACSSPPIGSLFMKFQPDQRLGKQQRTRSSWQ
jgi:hypothetical protein